MHLYIVEGVGELTVFGVEIIIIIVNNNEVGLLDWNFVACAERLANFAWILSDRHVSGMK